MTGLPQPKLLTMLILLCQKNIVLGPWDHSSTIELWFALKCGAPGVRKPCVPKQCTSTVARVNIVCNSAYPGTLMTRCTTLRHDKVPRVDGPCIFPRAMPLVWGYVVLLKLRKLTNKYSSATPPSWRSKGVGPYAIMPLYNSKTDKCSTKFNKVV